METPLRKEVLWVVIAVLFGVLVGWILRGGSLPVYENVRDVSTDYQFITPLLFVKIPEESAFPQYRKLKDALAHYVDRAKNEGKVADVSIYFRNLNTSQWVGVNTEERFAPASMLKIVTVMGVLREAEERPALLSARVRIPAGDLPTAEQTQYPPRHPVEPGKTYTVEELIEHLAVDSDNVANYALYSIVGDDKMMEIYDDFQLPRPTDASTGYSAQEYSRLFRSLYNGTYLSHDLSERVLEMLSRTNFSQGIVAGVPTGTTVSHKFGVRTVTGDTGQVQRELHDCGVVYYPNSPYFLCVMTRGDDFSELESVLKEASEVAWSQVSSLR